MPIKHIALSTRTPRRPPSSTWTSRHEADRPVDHPAVSGFFLTDGDLNLAVLNFKNDAVAGGAGQILRVHHIGFQVDSLEEIALRLAAGSRRDDVNDARRRPRTAVCQRRGEVQRADGVMVDVSETGWVGASGFRPQ